MTNKKKIIIIAFLKGDYFSQLCSKETMIAKKKKKCKAYSKTKEGRFAENCVLRDEFC